MKPNYVLPGRGANLSARDRIVDRDRLLDAASRATAKKGWSWHEVVLALIAGGFALATAARWAGWL